MAYKIKVKRALLSVSDKNGLIDFARQLSELDIEIVSTGGTAKTLQKAGIKVTHIEDVTGFPEILGGRVKTLHPNIHAGILAEKDNNEHIDELNKFGIKPIDLLVVNLYPFEKTLAKANATHSELIENIDIGGVTLLRAAAKNYKYIFTVINPDKYNEVINILKENDLHIPNGYCCKYAGEVFEHTSHYDSLISEYFNKYNQVEHPVKLSVSHSLDLSLRYGENPHQTGALYGDFTKIFKKLHGKELSYNNILDIDGAAKLINEFEEPSVAIFKHNNPCGVASGKTLEEAYRAAFATDTLSAFGGIIALNRKLDLNTAIAIDEIFSEVVIASDFSKDAFDLLTKKKNRILIEADYSKISAFDEPDIRTVLGGFLVQSQNNILFEDENIKIVSKRKPTEEEIKAMLFAWKISKYVKSNAIIFADGSKTLAIGAGQMSRIDSCKLAIHKAKEMGINLQNSVIASDGFFPFPDTLEVAASVGATAAISPGGSIKDEVVIEAADKLNMALLFTGIRHFRH